MVKIDFIENSGTHKMFKTCLFSFSAQDTEFTIDHSPFTYPPRLILLQLLLHHLAHLLFQGLYILTR